MDTMKSSLPNTTSGVSCSKSVSFLTQLFHGVSLKCCKKTTKSVEYDTYYVLFFVHI